MAEQLRRIGIERVPESPWGTHFCLFYRTKQDLLDLLVPYFAAGLEQNEFCMWITAEPLNAHDAREALSAALSNFATYVARQQIEILDYTQWYTLSGSFDAERVLAGWVEKERDAIQRGFAGLRLTGNTFWLEPADWRAFIDYEAAVDDVISQHKMVALCTYSLDKCGASEVIDVTNHHQFALAKRGGRWEMIESADRRRAIEAQRYAAELEGRVAERTQELKALNARLADENAARQKREKELAQLNDALRQSEQRYHALFESINEGFALHEIICDERGTPVDYRFLDINPAFERFTGLGRHDVIGKTARSVLPLLEEFWITTYGKVALTGEPAHLENYAAPLQQYYEVFAYRPAPNQFAVLFLNITERKRSEERIRKLNLELEQQAGELQSANVNLEQQAEELQVSNAQLEEALANELGARAEAESANKELESFAYSVSHDLRAPLASIENFARMLADEYGDGLPPTAQGYLRLVRNNADAMRRLIEGLLSFSRSSRQPLRKQSIQPADLVRQVLSELRPSFSDHPAKIVVGELPPCEGDALLLKQVWMNLLSNALKFSRPRATPQIEIGFRTTEGKGAYFVKDNGVGFDKAEAGNLFGVFQRLHAEEEFDGTGVGLAIVDRIVRRHGGRVWAEAQVDRGATFYFTL